MIDLQNYPQLRGLLWFRPGATHVREDEVLHLYERGEDYLDFPHMTPQEQTLVVHVIHHYGKDCFLGHLPDELVHQVRRLAQQDIYLPKGALSITHEPHHKSPDWLVHTVLALTTLVMVVTLVFSMLKD